MDINVGLAFLEMEHMMDRLARMSSKKFWTTSVELVAQ